ncbi:hypothetical protein BC827DRAFT_1229858, partial [Russula dissimulans]
MIGRNVKALYIWLRTTFGGHLFRSLSSITDGQSLVGLKEERVDTAHRHTGKLRTASGRP